jgi:hypothetical protein
MKSTTIFKKYRLISAVLSLGMAVFNGCAYGPKLEVDRYGIKPLTGTHELACKQIRTRDHDGGRGLISEPVYFRTNADMGSIIITVKDFNKTGSIPPGFEPMLQLSPSVKGMSTSCVQVEGKNSSGRYSWIIATSREKNAKPAAFFMPGNNMWDEQLDDILMKSADKNKP